MREIKFRSWDAGNKVMDIPDNIANGINGDRYGLMQYTGLQDKNGKEIYETDIVILSNVLVDGDKKVCKTIMDGWQSIFESIEDGFYCPMGNTAQNYREVIGNIYEHSYLLDMKTWKHRTQLF